MMSPFSTPDPPLCTLLYHLPPALCMIHEHPVLLPMDLHDIITGSDMEDGGGDHMMVA